MMISFILLDIDTNRKCAPTAIGDQAGVVAEHLFVEVGGDFIGLSLNGSLKQFIRIDRAVVVTTVFRRVKLCVRYNVLAIGHTRHQPQ